MISIVLQLFDLGVPVIFLLLELLFEQKERLIQLPHILFFALDPRLLFLLNGFIGFYNS